MKIPVVSGLLAKLKPADDTDVNNARKSNQPSQWNDESLELTLGTLLTNRESKSLGTVQAITLSDFRDSLDDLWERYEKNILLIAETTIDRSLGKGQTVIQQDPETWLLVTPDLTPAQAETFAANIASSIGEKLVGARFETEDDTDPTPQTGMVDLSHALSDDGSINREAIQKAVANARATIAAKKLRRKRERAGIAEAKPQGAKAGKKSLPHDTPNKTGVAETGLKLSYWPCWTAESQSIDTFVCRPVGQDGSNPFERDEASVVAANAVSVARACAVALNSMVKDGVRAKLVVPIPLQALLSPTQRQVLQALQKLQEKHRFLYLRPEIVRVPHSISTAALLTARDALRPLARDVAVLTSLFTPNKAVLSVSGMIIGCDAASQEVSSAAELLKALTKFKQSVHPRLSYVIGLTEKSAIQHAATIGFSEIGGPGLRDKLRRTPQKTEPLATEDLFSNHEEDLS